MTIPRLPRRYSIPRPWKTSRRTILLTPSFLYELQAWCKENVRTAPLPEIKFPTAGEENSCGIKNDLTTNASAATDTLEVVSAAVRTAAICYPFKPTSRVKPSLKITGKTLRIIDDCPVLILQMTRITCKLPTLIIAPDGYIPNSVIRQSVKFCGVVAERVVARKREMESTEEVTSKEETMPSGSGEVEQTKARAASLKEARRRVLREAVTKERELKQQQKAEVEESEFKKQFREEGRESADDDSRPKCDYPAAYEEHESVQSSRPPSKIKAKRYWSKMRQELLRKSKQMADARMQTMVPNTETELYSLELDVIFNRMSSRTMSLRTIDRSIHMDKEARKQLRKVLGGSEDRTQQFLAETTSPAGFLLYLTEVLGDRGKALALLEEASEGSITAYDELLRLLPDTEKLTKILSSFEAASKEAILILAPNVLLLPHVTHFLHAVRLYNLGRDDVASLLAGKWTPIGQPDSKEFRYTETLHLSLQEMTDFLTAFMANDVEKLRAMAAVLPANLKRVMKENDIADRFGKPDLLPNLNKKVQIADLLENPVEAVALSCSFNRENLFNDFKAPNLPTPLINYIDGLLANWKWHCAWEALNVINKRDPPVDVKPIQSLINHAGKLINLMEGNIRSTASNQLEPDEITQIVRQAIYGHPTYVLKLDELVGAKKRAFFLHGIHKTLGRVLMKLVHIILSGVDTKSIREFLAALADIVVSPIMKAFLSTWQNLVQMMGGTYGCQIEMRQTEREREFEMAQELIKLLTEVKSRMSLVQLAAPKSSSIIAKQWGQQAIPLRNEDSVTAARRSSASTGRRSSKTGPRFLKSGKDTGAFAFENVRAKVYTGRRPATTAKTGESTPKESADREQPPLDSGSETLPPGLCMSSTEEESDLQMETLSEQGFSPTMATSLEEGAATAQAKRRTQRGQQKQQQKQPQPSLPTQQQPQQPPQKPQIHQQQQQQQQQILIQEQQQQSKEERAKIKITPGKFIALASGKQRIEPAVSKMPLSKRAKQAPLADEQVAFSEVLPASSSEEESSSELHASPSPPTDSVSSSVTGGEDTEDVLLRMSSSPWSGHSGSFAQPDRSISKALLTTPSPVEEKALSLEVSDRRDSEKDSFDQGGGRSLSSASWSTATDDQGRSRRQKEAVHARPRAEEDDEDKAAERKELGEYYEELQDADRMLLAPRRNSSAAWATEETDQAGISAAAGGRREDRRKAREKVESFPEAIPENSVYPMVDNALESVGRRRRDEEDLGEHVQRRKLKELEFPTTRSLESSDAKHKKDAVGLEAPGTTHSGAATKVKETAGTFRQPLKVVDQTSKIKRARQLFTTRKAMKITLQTPLQDEESNQDELLAQIRNLPKYVAYQIRPTTVAEDCLKVQPVPAKQGLKAKPDSPGNAVLPDTVPLKKRTQSEEVLHPVEIRPSPKTAKRLSILGKVLKRSTETTSSLSSGLDSTSSDQSEIPQLHYFRPLESQVDEDAPKEMRRKDPIVLALIDTIMKCLAVFGRYSEKQMEAIAPRMFNCPFDPHEVINVPKGSIFSDDPDGAYMDLFCFQVLDTIRAGISIAANDRYLLTLAHNLLKTFSSLGDLGLAPPEDFRIAVQRQREADDEAEAEAEADSTFDEFTKWSEVKRRSYLGSDWFDEPSSDSGATLLYRPPHRKPITRQPEFWAHIREKQMMRKQRIMKKLERVETAQAIEGQTSRNIIRIISKAANAARKWEPGSDARRMMRSRIPNPYFEPLKGRPALLDDLIDRINAYGNYVGRLVRRRVQRSMAKCGFRERFPPFKSVMINNYRIIPRPTNIPSPEWRRLIGRGERVAYTTTDTGLCHRAAAALAPIIKLDADPDLSGDLIRNLDLINIIHAGTHSDNILRQTYLNA